MHDLTPWIREGTLRGPDGLRLDAGLLAGSRSSSGERLTTRAKTDPFLDSLYRQTSTSRSSTVLPRLPLRPAFRPRKSLAWLMHKPGNGADCRIDKVEQVEDALVAESRSRWATSNRTTRAAVRRAPDLRHRGLGRRGADRRPGES
jgi:hypothetical protein